MVTVATLYKFVEINDKIDLQKDILTSCEKYNVKGTILLANEGINGTISAQKFEITKVINSQKDLTAAKSTFYKNILDVFVLSIHESRPERQINPLQHRFDSR